MREIDKNQMKVWILLTVLFVSMAMCSCTKTVYIPVKGETVIRDSIRTEWKDSIVLVPVEKVVTVTLTDSSHLETSIAVSDAWVDGDGLLHHSLKNKEDVLKEFKSKDTHHYHDSIIYEPEPYPVTVEVPKMNAFQKMFFYIGIVSVLILSGIIMKRFLL